MITVWVFLGLLAVGGLLAAVPRLVDLAARAWGRRQARRLPHRPPPGAPPLPGPRHRRADAHTASVSATEIRAALEEQARQLEQQDREERRGDRRRRIREANR